MAKHIAPTFEIVTPKNAHKVVLKEWITGRDTEYINGAFFENMKAKPSANGSVEFGQIDLSKSTEVTHRNIERWVVTVDGVQDNILETVLDMNKDDYQAVINAIDEVAKKK